MIGFITLLWFRSKSKSNVVLVTMANKSFINSRQLLNFYLSTSLFLTKITYKHCFFNEKPSNFYRYMNFFFSLLNMFSFQTIKNVRFQRVQFCMESPSHKFFSWRYTCCGMWSDPICTQSNVVLSSQGTFSLSLGHSSESEQLSLHDH